MESHLRAMLVSLIKNGNKDGLTKCLAIVMLPHVDINKVIDSETWVKIAKAPVEFLKQILDHPDIKNDFDTEPHIHRSATFGTVEHLKIWQSKSKQDVEFVCKSFYVYQNKSVMECAMDNDKHCQQIVEFLLENHIYSNDDLEKMSVLACKESRHAAAHSIFRKIVSMEVSAKEPVATLTTETVCVPEAAPVPAIEDKHKLEFPKIATIYMDTTNRLSGPSDTGLSGPSDTGLSGPSDTGFVQVAVIYKQQSSGIVLVQSVNDCKAISIVTSEEMIQMIASSLII